MRNKHVRYVVLLGALAITGIIGIQAYFLYKSWTIRERQVTQTIFVGLKNVADRLCRFNHIMIPAGNPVKQVTSNYFVVEVNSTIDANILEYYLETEFDNLNLHSDYEYAIYNCATDRMVYGNYITASKGKQPPRPPTNLPKYNEYLYYFGIHFPNLKSTISADMALWFFLTGILVVSVLFFAYAIAVILQQKRLSELQKDFINNMTHEFKTPISSIGISAEVITSPGISNQPERLMTYGKVIQQENYRLNLMVEKVLQIARIEKGRIQLKPELTDLNLLVTMISDNFRANHFLEGSFKVIIDPAVGKVMTDVLHCTNIIHNLLENAIKYAGDQAEICIETRKEAGHTRLIVKDDGPGIPAKYRRMIFDKFFRVPSGDIHDTKGFGLGLYYVKLICRALKWNIRLESEPGIGSEFIIDIPETNTNLKWRQKSGSST
jgi:two-component system, OmpR family, phosphate regulon sensor histidine kinase PhoR